MAKWVKAARKGLPAYLCRQTSCMYGRREKTKFRLGRHRLQCSLALRETNATSASRDVTYKCCNAGVPETVAHVLFTCPAHDELRESFMERVDDLDVGFSALDDDKKLEQGTDLIAPPRTKDSGQFWSIHESHTNRRLSQSRAALLHALPAPPPGPGGRGRGGTSGCGGAAAAAVAGRPAVHGCGPPALAAAPRSLSPPRSRRATASTRPTSARCEPRDARRHLQVLLCWCARDCGSRLVYVSCA